MARTFFDRFFPHGAIDTQYSYVCVCVLKLSRYIKDITNKSFIEWVIDNRFFVCCKMCCCCFIHSFGLLNLKSEWVWTTFGAQFFRNRFIRFHFISSCGSYWLWHKKTCCRYPHFFSSIVVRICTSIFIFKRHPPPPPSKLAVVVFCSYSCSCGPFLHKCEHRNRCANVMYGRFSLLLVRVFSTVVRTVILVKKKKLAATLEQTLSNRFTKFVHSVVNSLWDELYSILNWLDIRTRKIK